MKLHVITDCQLQTRFNHVELAEMAMEGGADVVQFREKRLVSTAYLLKTAAAMQKICAQLIVNDRVDIAFACNAFGVHLGADDLPIHNARKILSKDKIIGATANDLTTAISLAALPINYLGVGPVFKTSSKQNAKPELGLALLKKIVENVSVPVIAIGGITRDNIAKVLQTGVHGVAVIADVVLSDNPKQATQILKRIIYG